MQSTRQRVSNAHMSHRGRLEPMHGLADNPGALTGNLYLPPQFQANSPLVVVLHGCTQTAVDYAAAAGWLELADRHGFAVLLPQQQRANNANLCFNWFEPGDVQRDKGEPASIKSMIDNAVDRLDIDLGNMFITGLSAGAAMAGTMLACYPEVFAGGGLIAGLPHGTASSMATAFQQMSGGPRESAKQLGEYVRAASDHDGPWPRVSIWHGDSDRTVNAVNGDATLAQWMTVHGLEDAQAASKVDKDIHYRAWRDRHGLVAVEHVKVGGMGHGTPINLGAPNAVGKAMPFVLNTGIASSSHLLAFWGIGETPEDQALTSSSQPVNPPLARLQPRASTRPAQSPELAQSETGVSKIINDALRAAGLMK